jgi:hypothetical protein
MTMPGGHRRLQGPLVVWPMVAFAAFAVAGFHALAYSISNAGPEPTFDAIVLRVEWLRLALLALAAAAPAGILAAALARLAPAWDADASMPTIVIGAAGLLAVWLAYQWAPGLVGA